MGQTYVTQSGRVSHGCIRMRNEDILERPSRSAELVAWRAQPKLELELVAKWNAEAPDR